MSSVKKTPSYSLSEIVEYIVEYKKVMKEIESMKREIQQVKNRFRPHITKLTKEKEKYEKIILSHLEQQNDPGIKFQDTVIYKEHRKFVQPKKDRDERLSKLLTDYNIKDPNFVKEITEIMKTKRMIDQNKFTLKMKSV